jgi:hypothetical protein
VTKDFVVETILGEEVGFDVAIECQPIVRQLLRTQHEDAAVTKLVVLDERWINAAA